MGEARQRATDEDQERHGQELEPMSCEQLVRGRRAQDVDDRADEAQDGDLDQRDDEADRHEGGEEGPDLPAIAPVIADEARRRRARVVVAKRVDAGFKETEHGFGSTGTWRPKPDFGKWRPPAPAQRT
jgi:hypothetical protein